MNILAVCNKSPYPPHDGGSLATYNLMTSLRLLGHNITLLTMCTPKHGLTPEDIHKLSRELKLHMVNVDTSISIPRFLFNYLFSRKPYNAERFISGAFKSELIRVLQSATFDIVQLEGLYLIPYAGIIRNYSKARIVLRAHNVEHEIWQRISQNETNPVRKFFLASLAERLNRFEKDALNHYDMIVPITERDKDEFMRMGNIKPAHVCPAGLNLPEVPEQDVQHIKSLFFLDLLIGSQTRKDFSGSRTGFSLF